MDRERNSTRTIYRSYVIDDGWNVPKEVIEAVDLRIEEAWAEKLYCKRYTIFHSWGVRTFSWTILP